MGLPLSAEHSPRQSDHGHLPSMETPSPGQKSNEHKVKGKMSSHILKLSAIALMYSRIVEEQIKPTRDNIIRSAHMLYMPYILEKNLLIKFKILTGCIE